ncbi:MAG: ABC transporter permease [Deltaproteobacteria bacterium]|nr:ABC transporter permease [Deltaproteobacteria bacterium]
MNSTAALLDKLGRLVLNHVEEMGKILIFFLSTVRWAVRPPLKLRLIFKQMEFVGVKSTFVVVLTGTFTGMVMALQGYYGFSMFNAESLVGSTVALGLTRELGPVLTALMVTARAGSAMAAELGSMRVTEQIDALSVMAANPMKYLVVPRIVAGVIMLPILTILSDFVGILGGYFVGVSVLGINAGAFVNNIYDMVGLDDIYNGLIKAAVFGFILSLFGCYKGFNNEGGAEGVGKATTEAVVLSSVYILVSDYFLTAIMF